MLEVARESTKIIMKLLNNEVVVSKGKEEGLRRGKEKNRQARGDC